jgi:hypothetical protein
MQKIQLTYAKPGMTLARDLFRGDSPIGIPICGKGTELTDALIARFKNMDVHTIYVEGHPIHEEGKVHWKTFCLNLTPALVRLCRSH